MFHSFAYFSKNHILCIFFLLFMIIGFDLWLFENWMNEVGTGNYRLCHKIYCFLVNTYTRYETVGH